MSDVCCVVCGEPWDYWGARHGEMKQWEWELFRKGAGCPSCEGRRPEGGGFYPTSLDDLEFGDEDPIERLHAWEDAHEGEAPDWQTPEAEVLWTCAGCGVQVVRDPDEVFTDGDGTTGDGLSYDLPVSARGRLWFHSHPYHRGNPSETPAHTFGEGDRAQPVCEFCLTECACPGCDAPICTLLEQGDPYEPGWGSTVEGYGCGSDDVFCVDCCSTCDNCGGRQCEHVDDCSCEPEHDDDDCDDDCEESNHDHG